MTTNSDRHPLLWLTTAMIVAVGAWLLAIAPEISRAFLGGGSELAGKLLAARTGKLAAGVMAYFQLIGLFSGFFVLAANREEDDSWRPWLSTLGGLSFLPLAAFTGLMMLSTVLGMTPPAERQLMPWGVAFVVGIVLAFTWLRYGVQQGETLRSRFSRRSHLERNRRTDVRELDSILPPAIGQFDARRFIDESHGYFVGLDERKKPIFIPTDAWRLSHVLLSGRTRSGKGVAAQILLTQAIKRGEFVVILDPKADEWMPHVFQEAAALDGKPYHFLDLRPGRTAQINPFDDCDEETIENMLIGAFSLAEKGEAADFYRLADRKAARQAARFLAEGGRSAADALTVFGSAWLERAPGFHAALEEMADLAPVNAATGGIDIDALARSGGCLYVVGDMGNTRVVRMQRMLLVRLMMLAKRMQAECSVRPLMTVFADEFKVHISRPFMTSLGAAAGWGMHCILAFQSLQDLADVPADLDKDSVRGAVMENCAIQLSYRIKDPETAEWLAASTGTILVDDEMRKVERNIALAETVRPERTIRLAERYYVDTNMLMNLPAGCGVLAGATCLPAFCYTSPVIVEKRSTALQTTQADQSEPAPHPAAYSPPLPSVPTKPLSSGNGSGVATIRQPRTAKPIDDEDFL